jgi:murein DD-endopeptidase MepM/ murein hydrolase activator NlpD
MLSPIADYKHALHPDGNVTQWFAMNPARYGSICYPDPTIPKGNYCLAGHNGIDIVAPWGTPLRAVKDGVIGDVKNSAEGYGKHLRLFCDTDDDVVEEWTYGHCSKILVKVGQRVKAGDVIAKMGNTGFVVSGPTPFWKTNPYRGTHLHLGLRYHKKWNDTGTYNLTVGGMRLAHILNYYNGYFGAVDFAKELGESTGYEYSAGQNAKYLTLKSLYNQLTSVLLSSRRGA